MPRCAVCREKVGFRKSLCARCMYFRTTVTERGLDWVLSSLRSAESAEQRTPRQTRQRSLAGKVGSMAESPQAAHAQHQAEPPAMESKSLSALAARPEPRRATVGAGYHDVVAVGGVTTNTGSGSKLVASRTSAGAVDPGTPGTPKDGRRQGTSGPAPTSTPAVARVLPLGDDSGSKPTAESSSGGGGAPAAEDKCVATHSFASKHPKQLSLAVGDVLVVHQRLPSGWWSGTNQDQAVCSPKGK